MRRGLNAFLAVVGSVMVVAGAAGLLLGAGTVVGAGPVDANVDSEIRFFAAWYTVAGALLLRSLRRIEHATEVVLMVGAGFFLAGCARALSWLVVGRPHWQQLALMAAELVLPFVIIPWHRGVMRSWDRGPA